MLIDRLHDDVKTAMKARDTLRLQVLRFTLSEIQNARLKKREKSGEDEALTDDEVIQVLQSAVKRRHESAEQYRQGDREDLATTEESEAEILAGYLPRPLSADELAQAVAVAVAETGATSMKQMGAVMKLVMSRHAGRVDGKTVQAAVKAKLGS